VFLNNGTGSFSQQATYAVGTSVEHVTVGDFNGDGYPDLAVRTIVEGRKTCFAHRRRLWGQTANQGANSVSVLLNKGDGTFASQIVFPVRQHIPRKGNELACRSRLSQVAWLPETLMVITRRTLW
jgi:hypothetical protein